MRRPASIERQDGNPLKPMPDWVSRSDTSTSAAVEKIDIPLDKDIVEFHRFRQDTIADDLQDMVSVIHGASTDTPQP